MGDRTETRRDRPFGREMRELAAAVALVELAERLGAGGEAIGVHDSGANPSPLPNRWNEDSEPFQEPPP